MFLSSSKTQSLVIAHGILIILNGKTLGAQEKQKILVVCQYQLSLLSYTNGIYTTNRSLWICICCRAEMRQVFTMEAVVEIKEKQGSTSSLVPLI